MSQSEKNKNSEYCEELLLDNQICFSVYTASRLISQSYQPLLEKLDLTYLQYLAMLVLWERDQINISELGFRLALDSGTLSPLIKKLEQKELLKKVRLKDDERIVVLSLTEKGKKLKKVAKTVPLQMLCNLKIPLADLQLVKEHLDKLILSIRNPTDGD